jgi:phage/plasmid-like protein (TIGR03299 family)
MSHELDKVGDEYAMAFVGDRQKVWHGLGQELEIGAAIEEWQRAAHMDWEINRAAVQYTTNGGLEIMYPDKNVLYRSDNGNALSVVSKAYKIVQPKEVLEFYRDLVGVADMQLETAGVLFGGRRFFALANTGRLAELKGDDAVKGYLLLSTSCDGTLATSAQFTSVRVVCNNTLSVALKEGGGRVRVPHNRVWKPSEVKEQLGLIDSGWAKFKDQITMLSEKPVEQDQGVEYLLKLFGDPEVPVDQQSPAVANKCANIWQLFKGEGMGSTLEAANGSFWGLLNAVTETVDHHTSHKTPDARMNNSFFGAGSTLKSQAFDLALAMAA